MINSIPLPVTQKNTFLRSEGKYYQQSLELSNSDRFILRTPAFMKESLVKNNKENIYFRFFL
jgi:hypothetical protein